MNTASAFVIKTLTSLIYPLYEITGLHLDNLILKNLKKGGKVYGNS